MGKLVRDLIPDIMTAKGLTPDVRPLDASEYHRALRGKLVEEALEAQSSDGDHLLEELADVYEVMSSIAVIEGFTWDDIVSAARMKRQERGGFQKRLYLET